MIQRWLGVPGRRLMSLMGGRSRTPHNCFEDGVRSVAGGHRSGAWLIELGDKRNVGVQGGFAEYLDVAAVLVL